MAKDEITSDELLAIVANAKPVAGRLRIATELTIRCHNAPSHTLRKLFVSEREYEWFMNKIRRCSDVRQLVIVETLMH